MMISIIRFRTSIESIEQKCIKPMLVLSLNAIDKILIEVKFMTDIIKILDRVTLLKFNLDADVLVCSTERSSITPQTNRHC